MNPLPVIKPSRRIQQTRHFLLHFIFFVALICGAQLARSSPVISEILYRPGTGYPEDTSKEFIEIYNPDDSAVDLSGWAITDGVDYTFPEGTSLAAGTYLVIASDPSQISSAATVLGPWESGDKLSNNGETITLSSPDGDGGWDEVDSVSYADEGDWAERVRASDDGWIWQSDANESGSSLERRVMDLDTDNGQNWGSSNSAGGTPGTANSIAASDIAPVVTSVKHYPAIPTSSDTVEVSAKIKDLPGSDISATLYWRDASTTSPGSFQNVPMSQKENGRFAASIDPQDDGAIIEFYVSASDGTNARTWPAPNEEGQTTNAAYQVSDETFDTVAPIYRLILTASENQEYENANTREDRRFHVTLIASQGEDITIRYNCGMRIRGNSSRQLAEKPLRIYIPRDNEWNGVSRFLLAPRSAPFQFLAHEMMRMAGLVAADVTPVELRRQGEEPALSNSSQGTWGFWCRVEDFNGDYLDNHFPDAESSQLYRKITATNWSSNYTVPTNPEGTYSGWDKQSNSSANDWSDVVNFSETWQSIAASHFTGETAGNVASGTWDGTPFTDAEVEKLNEVCDIDYLARWLACMTVMQAREQNLSTGEDDDYAAAFVNDGEFTRMYPIPHDLDTILGFGETVFAYNAYGLYDATEVDTLGQQGGGGTSLMEPLLPLLGDSDTPGNAKFRQLYLDTIRELLGTVFDADTSETYYPTYYAFIDNHMTEWFSEENRTVIKEWMTNRQGYLLGLIGEEKLIPDTATSESSIATSYSSTLRISEILAANESIQEVDSEYPDLVELRNTSSSTIDLSGYSLSDDPEDPTAYVFAEGVSIPANGYLVLYLDGDAIPFKLSSGGEGLHLYDTSETLVDEIVFGNQLPDVSIARSSSDENTWVLANPTFGAANGTGISLGNAADVLINEWAANTHYHVSKDFVELYNPSSSPVPIGGLSITDNLLSYPTRYTFPEGSYIPGNGFLLIDDDTLDFKLDRIAEFIYLVGANGTVIDTVDVTSQYADHSTGRSTDGSQSWSDFPVPTPGLSNSTDMSGYDDLFDSLRVTEIHYKPSEGKDYEFIELKNVGSSTLDLSGIRFTDGIEYTFAEGVSLDADAYIVVARDRDSFLEAYPEAASVLAASSFSGSLDNSGEKIGLSLPSPVDLNILHFEYEPDWYPETSDEGHSLALRDDISTDVESWDDISYWYASSNPGGSPGTAEPPAITSGTSYTIFQGDPYSYQIVATKDPISYGATGLPAGLSIDTETGLISGAPSESGLFEVRLSASSSAATAYLSLYLTIESNGELNAFVFDFVPQSSYSGYAFPVIIIASDSSGRQAVDFNENVTISASSGETTLNVTPNEILFEEGIFEGMLTIANAAESVTLTVSANDGISATSSSLSILDGSDSDSDGLPDSWESAHSLDSSEADSELDSDGDGNSNLEEFLAGTDPNDPSSKLAIDTVFVAEGNRLEYKWEQKAGKVYTIELSSDLENWIQVFQEIATSDASESDSLDLEVDTPAFLKIRVE